VSATLQQLQIIIRNVFFDDSIELRRDSTAHDVPGWDSLSHVRLLLTVEQGFGIRIGASEATRLANIGELVDLIERKLNAKGLDS
jgi:acyl carrier protein